MFCGACGHHLPDTNNFCTRCGAPVTRNLAISEENDVAVLTWKSDTIDYTNHGEISGMFSKILKRRVLIDLSRVNFIDSVGIGTLVTLYYKTVRTKQDIKIVGINDKIMKSIRALSVDNVLDIHESKEKAFGGWGLIAG